MPQLSVIVPTYNEAANIAPLVAGLETALTGLDWEVIFVDDDSADGTAEKVFELSKANPKISCIRRIGRRGLSSACMEGMLASSSPYLAVMDADLQHDESILPGMLALLEAGSADIVIGSRYMEGGGSRGGLNSLRSMGSKLATFLSTSITRQQLSDPMSGFFMLRREVFEETVAKLYGKGFKILLDIIASHDQALVVKELPFKMRPRKAGDSKLDSFVVADFLLMLIDRKVRGLMPARFFLFVLVGFTGVLIHMCTLYIVHSWMDKSFFWAQISATFIAMTSNFFLNNAFTFGDRKLHASALFKGLLNFYAVCSVGALINVATAGYLFNLGSHWSVAGLTGAAIGAIWNFSLSSWFTWRKQ